VKQVTKLPKSQNQGRVARKYRVLGRVQGVGYRYFAERVANQLGIRGSVKNLADGSVEVYAMGPESDLDAFKSRLADGPIAASVTAVEESEEAVHSDYHGFFVEQGR